MNTLKTIGFESGQPEGHVQSPSSLQTSSSSSEEISSRSSGKTLSPGAICFRLRGLPGLALAATILARYLVNPIPERSTAISIAGLLALGFGETMRVWSRRYIGRRSSTRRARVRFLITGGPFSRVRNPIYIGNLGLALGLPLLAGMPGTALVFFGLHAIVYFLAARHEESVLLQQHPNEGPNYVQNVPAWLPRLNAGGAVPLSPPVPWNEVLKRERNILIGVSIGALFFLLYA